MSDALLEAAVANWAPRFTANGVDPSDYARITSPLTRWDDWCRAWSNGAEAHLALGEEALSQGRSLSGGEALARAALYFHFGQFLFDHRPQERAGAHANAVAALSAALAHLTPVARRVEVAFEGTTLVGILRTPNPDVASPTVLLVAGLDSTKEEFREVERSFLERGLATFAFDGPGQGEAEHLAIRADWENVAAAVLSTLAEQREVDSSRVGVWGVSLGGYYAARIASADLPIAATACLTGPYDFSTSWAGLNPLTRAAFIARSHSASEDDALEVAGTLSMAGRAENITRPLLVIAAKRDRLISWRDAERLASEA
ncbi:MAG: alpha/beta fold hydrolase, partial [Acidobacteriota bacterium]|nr:alpha/beta fold hydrolase [Acidobacteriota bacterium]